MGSVNISCWSCCENKTVAVIENCQNEAGEHLALFSRLTYHISQSLNICEQFFRENRISYEASTRSNRAGSGAFPPRAETSPIDHLSTCRVYHRHQYLPSVQDASCIPDCTFHQSWACAPLLPCGKVLSAITWKL